MEELVSKAKNKNENAFDELMLVMEKEMYSIAKTRLKNDEDIAEAMQETILLCYKNIKKLRENALFKTWTIRILINECNKMYRKKGKQHISWEENELDKYIEAEENYEGQMDFDILIKELKPDEKLILTLYYRSGYTTKEISQILKKNENTVRSRMTRAKQKLKEQLKGESYERN